MEMLSLLVFPVLALLLFVLWKLMSKAMVREIGRKGLRNAPPEIHLEPATLDETIETKIRGDRGQLVALGFEEVGYFTVRELNGASLFLLVHPPSSVFASISIHPRGATWTELVTPYADGTAASSASLRATGLTPRDGCMEIRQPGANPAELYRRLLAERPQKPMQPLSSNTAVHAYERGYAAEMAWRRAHVPSTRELREVARLQDERRRGQ